MAADSQDDGELPRYRACLGNQTRDASQAKRESRHKLVERIIMVGSIISTLCLLASGYCSMYWLGYKAGQYDALEPLRINSSAFPDDLPDFLQHTAARTPGLPLDNVKRDAAVDIIIPTVALPSIATTTKRPLQTRPATAAAAAGARRDVEADSDAGGGSTGPKYWEWTPTDLPDILDRLGCLEGYRRNHARPHPTVNPPRGTGIVGRRLLDRSTRANAAAAAAKPTYDELIELAWEVVKAGKFIINATEMILTQPRKKPDDGSGSDVTVAVGDVDHAVWVYRNVQIIKNFSQEAAQVVMQPVADIYADYIVSHGRTPEVVPAKPATAATAAAAATMTTAVSPSIGTK